MPLLLTEDQNLMARTARSFVAKNAPTSRLRALREDPLGFDLELWKRMAELGWTRLPFSEAAGGLGLGLADVVCLTEELGRGLMTEPYLPTVLLVGELVARAGTDEQKARILLPLIAGESHVPLAHAERGSRFDVHHVETRARDTPAGVVITGEKAASARRTRRRHVHRPRAYGRRSRPTPRACRCFWRPGTRTAWRS
jgi:alkylation response protein AidB-like acyl-CoA dehydrogenase